MPRPANILVVLTDQQRADTIGCAGRQGSCTPTLDQLASEATLFSQAYCCQPLCTPSRCSMLTGLYPSAHGSSLNGIGLDPALLTYAEILRSAGWQTLAAGKMHLGPIANGFGHPVDEPGEMPQSMPYYGFERVSWVEGHRSPYLQMIARVRPDLLEAANHRHDFDPDGPFQTRTNPIPEALHRTAWTADAAIRLLKERDRGRPFLMHLSFWDPHHPFTPPSPWDMHCSGLELSAPQPLLDADRLAFLPPVFTEALHRSRGPMGKRFIDHTSADWRRLRIFYQGMISLLDHHLGRVLAYLKTDGSLADTLVIFVSDHGDLLGDHGLCLKGPFHYQPLITVPLLVRFPDGAHAGRRVRSPVATCDLMPTILSTVGLTGCPPGPARDLRALLDGRQAPRDAVLVEGSWVDDLDPAAQPYRVRTVVAGQHKLNLHPEGQGGEIYDLALDPGERTNLWQAVPGLRADLLGRLGNLMAEAAGERRQRSAPW